MAGSTKGAKPRGSIERLRSGSLRVRVYGGKDPISKRRNTLTETIPAGPNAEREAEKARTRLVHEVDEARHPRTSATVDELLDRYFSVITVERTTLTRYRQVADLHIRPLIGSQRAGRITGDVLDTLFAEVRRCRAHCRNEKGRVDHRTSATHACDDRCKPHSCKPLGEATIRKIHYILSGAFKKAQYWNWISTSPITGAEAPAQPPPNPSPPSAEDAARIINQSWADDPGWGTAVWLLMVTGLRRGEICAIRRQDIDLDNQVLHLRHALAQDGAEVWEKSTKTHQERRIVLDDVTSQLIAEHMTRGEDQAHAIGAQLQGDCYLFSNDPAHSVPLRPSSVTQRYRRLVRRLGIDTHLHALRDYSATELIAAGVDVRTVAGRLGHGGGGTTTLRVYTAWLSEADQRAAQALTERLPPKPEAMSRSERARTEPHAPYERIAADLWAEITAGRFPAGSLLPTVKQLQSTYDVSAGTVQRATRLLQEWGAIDVKRGSRAVVMSSAGKASAPDERSADRAADAPPAPQPLLDLRLLHLGEEIRRFVADADPSDPDHLTKLMKGAARRHRGSQADLTEYELEVRRSGDDTLITTFVVI
ncbi:tyrosine-type recombinase/integrase [Phytoactinopolyspora halotolerans]|uniref:Tyrosine-type recombinase/integrase n=1 Tax=Phytoactinopolyspora halotolerans TaxID=1981512 RepID=A0A6L9S959_9ACTN|nr:tyrosine-type recombinase/integrase [Phytoactinopolyspora halotolerans]NEE01144.1 tyrosine-type recombinase/integrase [Phytoactinopolyspora halotolerans]